MLKIACEQKAEAGLGLCSLCLTCPRAPPYYSQYALTLLVGQDCHQFTNLHICLFVLLKPKRPNTKTKHIPVI